VYKLVYSSVNEPRTNHNCSLEFTAALQQVYKLSSFTNL